MKNKRYKILFILTGIIFSIAVSRVNAKPWWWAQFSKGDNVAQTPNSYSKWHAFFLDSASDTYNGGVGDTVYIHSFTWSSNSAMHVPVTGISGADDVGINHIYIRRAGAGDRNVRLIGDADQSSWPVAGLNAGVGRNGESGVGTTHNKIELVANRGVITGSANVTDNGGFSSQPNNSVLFQRWAVSGVGDQYLAAMDEEFGGTFGDASANDALYEFNSPYGDTVEVYFSDDNGSIPGALSKFSNGTANDDMAGVLTRLTLNATESVFYVINRPQLDGTGSFNTYFDALIAFTGTILGAAQANYQGAAPKDGYNKLSADHTCRNGDDFYGFTDMHHKFQIFDQDIVATGSPNHTRTALEFNSSEENLVVIHDPGIARRYMGEWRRIMNRLNANPNAGGDIFEMVAPNAPTNLAVIATDTAFNLTWTAPANPGDFSRYYIFSSSSIIYTNKEIGDEVDNDGDGYYDEDPVGDWDQFSSGSTFANQTANDDDADGSADEDPWLYPEVVLKGATPAAAGTSGQISTTNVHDSFQQSVDYWFAIVAVDKQGNESIADTAGPFQLTGSAPDTTAKVVKNSDIADSNIPKGQAGSIAANIWIRGDSVTAGDTLSLFAVKNLGTATTADVVVKLVRDQNSDSVFTGADAIVDTMTYNSGTGRWEKSIANTSLAYLNSGVTGQTFFVVVDVYNTATVGRTFQPQFDAKTIGVVSWDSGPKSTVTNSGIMTITSANQISVAKRGDTGSAIINKGETAVIMTLRVGVSVANDTLTDFAVTNPGSMTNADVSAISIYEDDGADSNLTGADTWIANIPFSSGSLWRNQSISYYFIGTSINLLIVLQTSAGATGGRTFQSEISPVEVDTLNADSGPLASVFTSAVFTIKSDTSMDTAVVINEFLADATFTGADPNHDGDANIGQSYEQYVELYNNSDGPVDISGWDMGDETPGDATFPAGLVLGARQFIITYTALDSIGVEYYQYSSTGTIILDSGTVTGSMNSLYPPSNFTVDLRNSAGVMIDTYSYTSAADIKSWQRIYDGADTFVERSITPGNNQDPTASFDRPSPNATLLLSVSKSTFDQGESITLTSTMKDADNGTINFGGGPAMFYVDTGNITPSSSGSFSGGISNDSVYISQSSGSVTIRVVYNVTTYGTIAVTVTLPDLTAPDSPVNITPANMADTNDSTPRFDWSTSLDTGGKGVAGYYIEIDNNPDFSSPELSFYHYGTTSETTAPSFLFEDTYFWHVRAFDNAANTSAYSDSTEFHLDTGVSVSLTSPPDNTETMDTTPTFTWTGSGDTYNFQISAYSNFSSLVDTVFQTGLTYTPSPGYGDSPYYWRVIAFDRYTNTNTSTVWSIIVDTSVTVILSLPDTGTVTGDSSPTFTWITDGSTSTIQVATDALFTTIIDSATITATNYTPADPGYVADTYFWRVIATDTAGNYDTTAYRILIIDTGAPQTPVLLSPTNSSATSAIKPVFRWNVAGGADSYNIQVSADSAFTSLVFDDTTPNTYDTPSSNLASGTVYWRVMSLKNNGLTSGWSTIWELIIDFTKPSSISNVSPADAANTTTRTPTFSWTTSTDTQTNVIYYIEVSTSASFSPAYSIVFAGYSTATNTTPVNPFSNDTYYWHVYAQDDALNTSGLSAAFSLGVFSYSLSGTLALEARLDASGATVTIGNGTDTYITTSDTSGTFSFNPIKIGTYNLYAKEYHHLRIIITGIVVNSDTNIGNIGTLLAGESNNSNQINILDASRVKIQKGTNNFEGDIDKDGTVTDTDMQYIRNRFGAVGQ